MRLNVFIGGLLFVFGMMASIRLPYGDFFGLGVAFGGVLIATGRGER